jgi:hypothetical protein
MNIKQFLVIHACYQLPSDIICKIWEYIKDSSADSIRAVYFRKVEKNLQILRTFIDFTSDIPSNPLLQWSHYCIQRPYKKYSYEYVNNVVKFYMDKITFKYILGSLAWVHFLLKIIEVYDDPHHFHINNVYFIINNIRTTTNRIR